MGALANPAWSTCPSDSTCDGDNDIFLGVN
jgi:hypothetical protein